MLFAFSFVNFGDAISLYDYFERDRSIYWSPNEPFSPTMTKDRLLLISQLSHEIVERQQQLLVLTTFNLIAIYFNYRSMINEKCNQDQLKLGNWFVGIQTILSYYNISFFYSTGVSLIANFLKKLDVLLSHEIPTNSVSDITDSLKIHANVLRYGSNDRNASLQLVYGSEVTAGRVDPAKLKGHNLAAHTMHKSLPYFMLQIYANPCLFWLHQPAFYVLLQRLNTPAEQMGTELDRMKEIFANEFITRKMGREQDSKRVIDIMESINVMQNDELANLLLTSVIPFIFCYLQVVEVIKSQVKVWLQNTYLNISFI